MTYKALCDLDFPRHSSYSSPPITPFFAHPPACLATSLLSAFCTHSSPSQLHPSLPLSSQVTISVGLAWLELQLPPPRLAQHSLCPILTSIFPLAPSDTILIDIFYGGCFVCVSHHTHTQTHNFGMKLQENRNWLTVFMAISPDSRTHSRAQVCGMLDIINEHLAQFSKVYRLFLSRLMCLWKNAGSEAHPRHPELKSVRLSRKIFMHLAAHKRLRTTDLAQPSHFTRRV